MLTPKPGPDRRIQLLLRADGFTAGQELEMRVHGQAFQISPRKLVESSDEFDLAEFEIAKRIS